MNNDLKKRGETYKLQKYVDKLLADESITLCYSKKRGMYERPGGSGYTEYMYSAGVFPKADVCKWSLDSHGEITVIPVNIDKHNHYIMEKIEELRGNLIPTTEVKVDPVIKSYADKAAERVIPRNDKTIAQLINEGATCGVCGSKYKIFNCVSFCTGCGRERN